MVKVNRKELRARSNQELEREIAGLKDKLRQSRFELASGRVKNIREIRTVKRQIARLNTILAERKQSS